ncbi:hypothetical protein EX30DRAFT_342119 [Ascodesmis nigricans]|uniref:Uncharacterized protein n=1 Tax=Ascodesmis nigricans TaxID=341454 RepID=A0A4V3SIF2_9PEZI|nr:hypothetical protein EX30DRAFT_342119 [Ascodesmis nigricans]
MAALAQGLPSAAEANLRKKVKALLGKLHIPITTPSSPPCFNLTVHILTILPGYSPILQPLHPT